MAPPTRLRPHLNDLLQKNLELEHVVADLRHQLTQSAAKWADERKTLAVGCDALMASFAKFRARLDVHPSDWGDSEGEVEQNLDAGGQGEETVEVDNGMLEPEGDQGSPVAEDLHERCHALVAELQVKEEELEESRRKHEAAEEELQRVQRLLEAQSEQLRAALASTKADTDNKLSPERTPDDNPTQANPSKTELGGTLEKLDLANQEIIRLKQLLQQWQKYGNDWKRDAQSARVRASELEARETELSAQVKAAEESSALLDTERKEIQRLTSALADQTAAVEHQRTACQESVKRIHDLEAMVALLRAQLSPEQLTSFDSGQNQAALGPSNSTQSPTPHPDTNTNKRSDMIVLKIPFRSIRRPPGESNGAQDGQQHVFSSSQQIPADSSMRASPVPQTSNNLLSFNSTDFELCIHTCNPLPCRNESQSFLWPRKQASLPRHALSAKKHRRCTPDCPGHRLLTMTVTDALKEPRSVKCRPPSEAELALAAEEAKRSPPTEPTSGPGTGVEVVGREGSGEPDEPDEPEEGSTREEEVVQERGEEQSPRRTDILILGKRLRSRPTDSEESQRARKLRPRISVTAKP
ncbi:hypothetical protein J3R83DRAFT_12380 [Lanmaoa asiatica]|nr:hypothetical protein J3R83DRAFT_12380 [Lanmaoa asiatica]